MEQVGLVTNIYGDKAEIEVKRVSACGHSCDSCSGECNIPPIKIKIPNTLNVKEGDYVEIQGKTKGFIKSTMILYMIPFLMLLFGMFLGIYVFKTLGNKNYENYGFLTGLIFLSFSYIILKKIDKKVSNDENLNFEMIRKL
ncbi:SoxR reducing system RseC family protein [Anaerosalibacter sp. Marseille-P3206]|uniref:SoxR reducing system RseC family protein n=1 Tax=Anaerosalibacter sp. Marseille-P3206 TaxID=1871005 RepID=UPI0009848F8F|nr:SoxR reducing system RseC family protein [Anaerosalibacter sp. Marseille-P3206]